VYRGSFCRLSQEFGVNMGEKFKRNHLLKLTSKVIWQHCPCSLTSSALFWQAKKTRELGLNVPWQQTLLLHKACTLIEGSSRKVKKTPKLGLKIPWRMLLEGEEAERNRVKRTLSTAAPAASLLYSSVFFHIRKAKRRADWG
jgi:hypothetical protein